VFFNGGIAFHEGSLTSASHGCVRLSPAAARTWFATLAVGDLVQVVP
jgi:lipoprotein-anchoring transpeptidase ErfK/SrfK